MTRQLMGRTVVRVFMSLPRSREKGRSPEGRVEPHMVKRVQGQDFWSRSSCRFLGPVLSSHLSVPAGFLTFPLFITSHFWKVQLFPRYHETVLLPFLSSPSSSKHPFLPTHLSP